MTMIRKGKVWGETVEIFNDSTVSTHVLEIEKGGFCSEHKHDQKSNIFYVIQGGLEVIIWTQEGVKDKTILQAGQGTTVPAGVWHKFHALTDVICVEIYTCRFIGQDIERRTTGGRKE